MTTIFTFLSDQYQHELKQQAENGNPRFEKVMANYKDIFWKEFDLLSDISTCTELHSKTTHLKTESRDSLNKWLSCLQSTIASDRADLMIFFDELIEVYQMYIQGNIVSSSNMLNDIMARNNLFRSDERFEDYYPVTYRGRTNTNQDSPILSDYFYHVPFSKLHLVKNYRFSINGQPFIYLGASLPTVLLELRSDLTTYPNIELSSWSIKLGEQLKVYDISNALFDLINLNMIPIFAAGSGVSCHDTHNTPNISTFITDFKKFIISQFCTFKKKELNGQVFIEQYVLPQLLTEQIRSYKHIKYDGFIFPSTQYLDRANCAASKVYYGLFKNNIALFTDYSSTEEIDNALISKFEIRPINKANMLSGQDFIEASNKIDLRSDVDKLRRQIRLNHLKDYYETMMVDKMPLTELPPVKVQFHAMLDIIKDL